MPGFPLPYFVVGCVRSGTTVLRLMLGQHPGIGRCEETEFLTQGWTDVPPSVAEARATLRGSFESRVLGLEDTCESGSFVEWAEAQMIQCARATPGQLVGGTVHNHFDRLARLWPDARFIHLVRDPRDVARSCVAMGFSGNAWGGAGLWMKADDCWRRLCEQVPASQRIEVRFEDFVRAPEAEATRLLGFLGLAYDDRMMAFDPAGSYRPPSAGEARSWRDTASRAEVRAVEWRTLSRMAGQGYAPELVSAPPAAWRKALLRLGNALGRGTFSWRRYGGRLTLMRLATRLLPRGASVRKRLQHEWDTISIRHLK